MGMDWLAKLKSKALEFGTNEANTLPLALVQ